MNTKHKALAILILLSVVLAGTSVFAAGTPDDSGSAAAEPREIIFRLDWLPSAYHAPVFVALDKGYWTDRGLDVEVQFGKGSTDTAKMVATEQAEFGWANTVVTTHAIETGMPLKTVYGTYQRNALGIMVLESSGIKSAADMTGKKITMTGAGEEAVLFPLWMKMNGVDESTVERVLIESRETRRAMFLEGKVDAFWETLFSNIPILQKQTDEKIIGIMISEGPNPLNLLLQGVITNTKTIEEDPQLVRDFVAGFKEGFQYSMDDPEGAMDILMRLVPEIQDREVSLGILQNSFKLLQTNTSEGMPLGAYAEEDWDATLDLMLQMGNLEEIKSHDNYYTNEFVPAD
jgi:NitT/TauT family transport system substrate-binding protein